MNTHEAVEAATLKWTTYASRLLAVSHRPNDHVRVHQTHHDDWTTTCDQCGRDVQNSATWLDAMEAAYGHICMGHNEGDV